MSRGVCRLWYCKRPVYAHGLCATHYQSTLRNSGEVVGHNSRTLVDLSTEAVGLLRVINAAHSKDFACDYCWEIGTHRDDCPLLAIMALLERIDKKMF